MSNDILSSDQWNVRDTDSNSLLRLYDLASQILNRTGIQYERTRADRIIQRIAKELRKRNVKL